MASIKRVMPVRGKVSLILLILSALFISIPCYAEPNTIVPTIQKENNNFVLNLTHKKSTYNIHVYDKTEDIIPKLKAFGFTCKIEIGFPSSADCSLAPWDLTLLFDDRTLVVGLISITMATAKEESQVMTGLKSYVNEYEKKFKDTFQCKRDTDAFNGYQSYRCEMKNKNTKFTISTTKDKKSNYKLGFSLTP